MNSGSHPNGWGGDEELSKIVRGKKLKLKMQSKNDLSSELTGVMLPKLEENIEIVNDLDTLRMARLV